MALAIFGTVMSSAGGLLISFIAYFASVVNPLITTIFHDIINFTNRTHLVVNKINNDIISNVTYQSLVVL